MLRAGTGVAFIVEFILHADNLERIKIDAILLEEVHRLRGRDCANKQRE